MDEEGEEMMKMMQNAGTTKNQDYHLDPELSEDDPDAPEEDDLAGPEDEKPE